MLLKELLENVICKDVVVCISPAFKWNKWIEIIIDNDIIGTPKAAKSVPYTRLLDMQIESWHIYPGLDDKVSIEIALYMSPEEEKWFLNLEEIQTMGKA